MFTGRLQFLSNFEVLHGGIVFDRKIGPERVVDLVPTLEHAYQAHKPAGFAEVRTILKADTPGNAKRLGQRCVLRPDWEDVRLDIMWNLLARKFAFEPLRSSLLGMEGEIVEWNQWHDSLWGACLCGKCPPGENWLGKLLMQVRGDIRRREEMARIEKEARK